VDPVDVVDILQLMALVEAASTPVHRVYFVHSIHFSPSRAFVGSLRTSPALLFFSASAETLGVHILRKGQDEFANQSAVRC
jgi:hypothetical protein